MVNVPLICLNLELFDCYNIFIAYTNPEVQGLVPLACDCAYRDYIMHLAGLA